MNRRQYYVYILTNPSHSSLYIGVTNNLLRRVYEHRDQRIDGFTKKYHCIYLVYYEEYSSIDDALNREKQLKNWHSEWKWNLIRKENPTIEDLTERIIS